MNKLLSVILTLLGCGSNNNASTELAAGGINWEETTLIEYRYGDSSVAPNYHRSYVITISDSTKTIAIDSYGKVLLRKQYANTPADFLAFKEELSKTGIKKHKKKDNGACAGGTSETLKLYNANEMFFNAYVYHCSGEGGTLTMPNGATRLILGQIPESVDSLINSTIVE